ncbi:MAG: DNA repair protein RecN [Chitinophagaceae bacterium BSSC1]|nr:MAG: DNA repair protein RecN [Chitinophagaceae bacterium BSSC1]
MLRKLQIQHYAIIDAIDIEFSGQLNIITGETGAGKSILMGALSLILGDRADSSVLMYPDKKCVIEGYFSAGQKTAVLDFLKANDFDLEDELVLRREIAPNGKSRAFINDTPTTLQQIRELASLLVDLHQQFDTLSLGDASFQRNVIDALAANQDRLQAYQIIYQEWQQTVKRLDALIQQKQDFQKDRDYHQFQLDELAELSLKENELEELDAELQLLSNAEGIKTALSKLQFELEESEQPVLPLFKQWINQLQSFSGYHSSLQSIIDRLHSSQVELQDIADEIGSLNGKVHFDEKRIEWINERLTVGYRLLKKHGAKTTQELLDIQQNLASRLEAVLQIDDTITELTIAVEALAKKAVHAANELSVARKAQQEPLASKVNALLHQVGMPNARLKITIDSTQQLQAFGHDQIEFLFDANKSNRFEPIRKVASGGELSRLMLCIKSLVAESIDLATLIFDEIDTGISGEAAKQVGLIMKELSKKRQIICITHQPQIAGKASAHFYVYKENQGNRIKTNLKLLEKQESMNAIARMLGGETPSAAAIEHAKEMMLDH